MPDAPPVINPPAANPVTPAVPPAHASAAAADCGTVRPATANPGAPPVPPAPAAASAVTPAAVRAALVVVTPVAASRTIGTGDNAVLYTARSTGAPGNNITVAHAAPSVSETIDVSVSGQAITVTPGIHKSGVSVTIPALSVANCALAGTEGIPGSERNIFTSDAEPGYSSGASRTVVTTAGTTDTWYIFRWDAGSNLIYQASKASTALSPVGLTTWTITVGTGQPVVAAESALSIPHNKNECVTAVNASAAANMVVASPLNGPGHISTASATNLTGGAGLNPPAEIST